MSSQPVYSLKDRISETTQWGFDVGSLPVSTLNEPTTTPTSPCQKERADFDEHGYLKRSISGRFKREFVTTRCFSISLPSLMDIKPSSHHEINKSKRQDIAKGGSDDGRVDLGTPTLEQIWRVYANETTCHGIRNVVDRRRRKPVRIAWLIGVIFMLSTMTYNVFTLLVNQQTFPTITRTDFRIQDQPDFPSVTFCNKSPLKNVNKTTYNPMYIVMANGTMLRNQKSESYNTRLPEISKFLEKPAREVLETYMYTKKDLFVHASYEGQDIDIEKDFEVKITATGNCFSFNGPTSIKRDGIRKVSLDGRRSGLKLLIDVNQESYVPFIDFTAGVQMYVTHHPETPRFEQDGLDLQPGTSTKVALNPTKFQFLPDPFASFVSGSCADIQEGEMLNKVKTSPFYDRNTCRSECEMKHAHEVCKCSTPLLGRHFDKRNAKKPTFKCDCPRPCTFTRYDIILSSSQLPSRPFWEYFHETVNASSVDHLRENYLQVRVYLESMLLRRETHEPKYTLSSIVGNLGGQMGFFLGASLMTLAELVETCIHCCIFFMSKVFTKSRFQERVP